MKFVELTGAWVEWLTPVPEVPGSNSKKNKNNKKIEFDFMNVDFCDKIFF